MILLLRRLPVLFKLKPLLKDLKLNSDFVFVGWFGPIGVAALYYAVMAHEKLPHEEIWAIPALIIFTSVIVHAATSYPFVKKNFLCHS
ncbi:MAG: hypothetical protein ACNS62_00820 [Candidatus Cyclobacteriaceae bacterium M3_2C_046]